MEAWCIGDLRSSYGGAAGSGERDVTSEHDIMGACVWGYASGRHVRLGVDMRIKAVTC